MPGKKPILLVDDNEKYRKALTRHLNRTYEVLEAENQEDAQELYESRVYEVYVAVVDKWMPHKGKKEINRMAGFELSEQLQNIKSKKGLIDDLPVILLTGHHEEEDKLLYEKYKIVLDILKSDPNALELLEEQLEYYCRRKIK